MIDITNNFEKEKKYLFVGEERSLMKEKFPVKLGKVLLVDSAVL